MASPPVKPPDEAAVELPSTLKPWQGLGESQEANGPAQVSWKIDIDQKTNGHNNVMEPISDDKRLMLQFVNVCAWVQPSLQRQEGLLDSVLGRLQGRPRPKVPKQKHSKQIMYNLSGSCRPGELLALMGPSGSSKTSLLLTLGSRSPRSMKTTGSVTFNGAKVTKLTKRQLGFVLQDDLMHETLTVYEVLYYAAMLRLPREMTRDQKLQRIESVILALGLDRCRDTVIGGFMMKGISGGERKRVSVGHELLVNPSVLLLDEPTSGLDSTTAMHLVGTLRQLASPEGGRTVVTTIHQPASRLYQQLDKLILLSEGHVMYYGDANRAADWFCKLGFMLPAEMSTPDFILDLSSGDVATAKLDGQAVRRHLIECAEAYLSLPGHDGYRAGQDLSAERLGEELWAVAQSRRKLLGAQSGQLDHERGPRDVVVNAQPPTPEEQPLAGGAGTGGFRREDRWGAPYRTQFSLLLNRCFTIKRFNAFSKYDLMQYGIVGVLAGLYWLQRGQTSTVSGASNITGLLFFEVLLLALRAMQGAMFTFVQEFKMLVKERQSGMYHLSAFFFARQVADLPLDCAVPSMFVIIVYFMGGLRYTPWAFFANWAATMLALLSAQSVGLLVGALVTVPKMGNTLVSVIALTMALVSGFFVFGIPRWIAWMKYLSFVFYGYNLLLKIEFEGRTLYNCGSYGNYPNPQDHPDICTPVPSGQISHALNLPRNVDEWPWEPIFLIGWCVVFRFVVFIALRRRTRSIIR